ncbi:LuxR C-terminal-related transcriptional regulator [Sphingorhabdus sp. EL138]|uniref:LuxR C-terminal-related transcriptional regulator n=1 Tax=Sphingorhabdus sp. EL138 TaxID=2073156 RepID=UPI0013A59707|nr:LuxR C-terminal-related transcriptional regulator [Sphingorhabdus sp. EL138]
MDDWLKFNLCIVVAPAGYAKSSTISQWSRRESGPKKAVAWLTLDEADSEPTQFISYFIASLSSASIPLKGLEMSAEEGFAAGGILNALSSILEMIEEFDSSVVVVLDDYHRVGSPEVDELVVEMLSAAPDNLTIVISSRTVPAFQMSHLFAEGRACELSSDDLRFSKDELGEVFNHHISDEIHTALFHRTEGWPVAVQLAKLLVKGNSDNTALGSFKGSSGHIASYLAEQIVGKLDADLQMFLMQTSQLENYTSPLAAAVTNRADCDSMIAQLELLNALIVPVNEEEESYRYHHLFNEYLRKELHRRHGSQGVLEVHRRASRWYEENGYIAEAVRHARLSHDIDRCAELIAEAGGWELILFGGIGYLRGLLQQVPPEEIKRYPRLLLAQAYLHMKDGLLQKARALFDMAANNDRHSCDLKHQNQLERDLLNVETLLSVYEDIHITADTIENIQTSIDQIPASDPVTKSIITSRLIASELAIGQFFEAEDQTQSAIRGMREAGSVLGANYMFLHAGIAAMYQGRLRAAEAHFSLATKNAEENFAYDPGPRAISRILAAYLNYWTGRPQNNPDEQIDRDIDQVERYDGWLDVYHTALIVENVVLNKATRSIERFNGVAKERGLVRLAHLTNAAALKLKDSIDKGSLALRIQESFPIGRWEEDPFCWLPYLESRLALAHYFSSIDRSLAIEQLDDGLECARSIGANLHLVALFINRSKLFFIAGQREAAVIDLVEALTIAAPESMRGPFIHDHSILPLLRAVLRHAHDALIDILVIDFTQSLITELSKMNISQSEFEDLLLSRREQEVLAELVHGRSNKEIARILDMTEHTVKFHLKNIYAKLKTNTRTKAVIEAKRLGLA